MRFTAILIFLFVLTFSNVSLAQSQSKTSYPINGSLTYVTQLQPITFGHNLADAKNGQEQGDLTYGFDIEALKKAVPGIVKTQSKLVPAGKNNYRSIKTQEVDMARLIPLLVGSIKEQQQEIERLKAEMASMKKAK